MPVQVKAADLDQQPSSGEIKTVVSGDGVVTSYVVSTTQCLGEYFKANDQLIQFQVNEEKYKKSSGAEKEAGIVETINNVGTTMVVSVMQYAIGQLKNLFELSCGDASSLGVVNQLFVLSKTVNVTYFKEIMGVTAIVQWLCLALSLLMIAFYGITMSSGIQQTPPMEFAIRMFMGMLGVYLAPYLLQDILNINNYVVHNLMQIKVSLPSGGSEIPVIYAFPAVILQMFTALADLGGLSFVAILVALVAILASIIPLFKLVIWWYTRWFKIMIYTVISPFMFLSVGLKETSKTAGGFIKNFVRDVFSQVFVVLGVMLVTKMLPTLIVIIKAYNLGFVGIGITLYAMLTFLAELPNLANSLLDGDASRFGLKSMEGYVDSRSKTTNGKMFNRLGAPGRGAKRVTKNAAGAAVQVSGKLVGGVASYGGRKIMQAVKRKR